MVTANNRGPVRRARRQRATSHMSAVESAPPETASTRAEASASGSNSALASAAETGAASSAADTLLFSLDPLFHARRCARKLAWDFCERGARRLSLAERRQRLPQAKERIGRLGARLVFGRDVEECLRRVAETLALEQTFAEQEGGLANEAVVGISLEEAAKAVLGERVVLAQHVAVGEVVFIA